MRRYLTLVVPLVLASCATPADVTADHERDVRGHQDAVRAADATYRDDLAVAQNWDHHFMGIPASGWVPILIFACLFTAILLGAAGYRAFNALADRRQKRHELNVAREKTLQEKVKRGRCLVCGEEQLSPTDREKLGST